MPDSKTDCDKCTATYEAEVLLCPLHKAAPDLLAALKALVADYTWSKGKDGWYAQEHPITAARAAIAKAEPTT